MCVLRAGCSGLVLLTVAAAASARRGFAVSDAEGRLSFVDAPEGAAPKGALALGVFEDSIERLGTGQLWLETLRPATDETLFEALGLLEGALTADRTTQHMHNIFAQQPQPPEVLHFLSEHLEFLHSESRGRAEEDPYWTVVACLLARNRGIREGLKRSLATMPGQDVAAVGVARQALMLTEMPDSLLDTQLLRMNLEMDVGEIARALAERSAEAATPALLAAVEAAQSRMRRAHGHCSVLIKAAGERLLAGHNTWKGFHEMLRIWKDVSLTHVSNPAIVNRRLSYSSYPGYFASTDDWIMLPDSELAITETTDEAFDTARLAAHVSHRSLTTPLRSMVASLMADSARGWYEVFSRENSGTQNNEWMVLDYKVWRKYRQQPEQLPENLFWVLEQQPGLIVGKDMSEALLTTGFWSSYNIPRFNRTLGVSEQAQAAHITPSLACAGQRAELLRVAERRVHSREDLQELLTTNTWQSEPDSWSCPHCAVASRYDLAGLNATLGGLQGEQAEGCSAAAYFGAIDAKVTDDLLMAWGQTLFVSGPPSKGVPAFSWADASTAKPAHEGHPSGTWTFPWLRLGSTAPSTLQVLFV